MAQARTFLKTVIVAATTIAREDNRRRAVPPWYDVDDQPALERLIAEVRASEAGVTPHT